MNTYPAYGAQMHPWLLALIHWLVSGVALLLTSYLVPGFRVRDFGSALVAALVIGLINALIRPLLIFLTLPINILTLGLFTFVIDGLILKMTAALLKGFEVTSWFSAILGAFLLAVLGGFLHLLIY